METITAIIIYLIFIIFGIIGYFNHGVLVITYIVALVCAIYGNFIND